MREDGKVVIQVEASTKQFDKQMEYVENRMKEIDYLINQSEKGEDVGDVLKLESEYEKLKNQLIDLQVKKQKAFETSPIVNGLNEAERKLKDINEDVKKIQPEIQKIGNSFEKTTKKISKWGLAIFGIRSAYLFILKTAREIGNQNQEVGAKLDAIKNSLTNLLAPVVETIINLVYRLIAYLNVITKSFLGLDLFKKSANSAEETLNATNKLKKTLAGFDEMNVLSDTSTSSGASTTSEPELPDTSKFEKNVGKFKEMWNELLETERATMAQIYLDNDSTWGLLSLGWFDTIQGLTFAIQGIINVVKGVFDIIIGIVTGDGEKIKDGVKLLLTGIGNLLRGLLQFILGIIEMILGVIWGAIVSIGTWFWDNLIKPIVDKIKIGWEAAKAVLASIANWIYDNVIKPVGDFFKGLWEGVKNAFIKVWEFIKNAFSKGGQLFNGLKDGIVNVFKTIVNALISGVNRIVRIPFDLINGLLNKIRNISILGISPFKKLWKENPLPVPQIPKLAKGGIVNNPGRGVMMGNYVAGEKGPEAVLPLTDDTLQKLANMIPITINLSNNMNGRVISREIIKTQNESNFAFNR